MIPEIFSRRQRRLRGEFPDVYQYDSIPEPLRNQIIYILRDFFHQVTKQTHYRESSVDGYVLSSSPDEIYDYVVFVLNREYGLPEEVYTSNRSGVESMLLHEQEAGKVMDIIELLCRCIRNEKIVFYLPSSHRTEVTGQLETFKKEAFDDLNTRFQDQGVGYQFEPGPGEIIRVDSQYIHSKVVRPALNLLSDPMYESAIVRTLFANSA